MKKILLLVSCIMLLASNVWAFSYHGEMDNRDGFDQIPGFTAQGNAWNATGGKQGTAGKGMRIEWTVDDTTNSPYYTYTYTLVRGTALNKAFALFDIETGTSFTGDNINSVQTIYAKDRNDATVDPSTVYLKSNNSANFNATHTFLTPATSDNLGNDDMSQYSGVPTTAGAVPHPFYGLRWKFPTTTPQTHNSWTVCSWQVQIVSDRAPMWGKFFGWGDQTSTSPYTYANFYSNGIDSSSRPTDAPSNNDGTISSIRGWILVPGDN